MSTVRSRKYGPVKPPTSPRTDSGVPEANVARRATLACRDGRVPRPSAVRATAESSSAKSGFVVRSTKRTNPSSIVSVPIRTRTGAEPVAVERLLPAGGDGVGAVRETKSDTSSKLPSELRSNRSHGLRSVICLMRMLVGYW